MEKALHKRVFKATRAQAPHELQNHVTCTRILKTTSIHTGCLNSLTETLGLAFNNRSHVPGRQLSSCESGSKFLASASAIAEELSPTAGPMQVAQSHLARRWIAATAFTC